MNRDDLLKRLPAKDPLEIVRVLAGHRASTGDRGPKVSICTREGHVQDGWILALDEKASVVLLESGTDLCYQPLASISALRVEGAAAYAKLLSFGAVARDPGEAVPSRFVLKRQLAKDEGSPRLDVDWDSLPEGDEATANARDLAAALRAALGTLAKHELGGVERARISHRAGARLAAARDGKHLGIEADLGRALPAPLGSAVKDAVEKAL